MADEEAVVVEETAPTIEPRVGQGVHYVTDDYSQLEEASTPGGTHVFAVITEVHEENAVTLQVIDASGAFTVAPVSYDASGAVGTWHYPEV